MRKNLLIVGVILLVLGIIIFLYGFINNFLLNENVVTENNGDINDNILEPYELRNDYDRINFRYKSYDPGDNITVTGIITEEIKQDYMYIYILDNESFCAFNSEKDIGNVSDKITVKLKLYVINITDDISLEGWSFISYQEMTIDNNNHMKKESKDDDLFLIMIIIGINILIIGIALILIGKIKKQRKIPRNQSSMIEQYNRYQI